VTIPRWIALGLAICVVLIIVLASMVYGRSVVIVRNVGEHEATVDVGMMNASQFAWKGRLLPGERVIRPARFSDNSFRINCRDISGEYDHQGGYVTNGTPQLVTLTVNGCADVTIHIRR